MNSEQIKTLAESGNYAELIAFATECKKNQEEAEKATALTAEEEQYAGFVKEGTAMKKPELVEEYARLRMAETKRKKVNSKKANKTAKKTGVRCNMNKCFANKELVRPKHSQIPKGKFNDFKVCGKAVSGHASLCEKCFSGVSKLKNETPLDGVGGNETPFAFPHHTSPAELLWVEMVYDLHPKMNPAPAEEEAVEEPVEEAEEELVEEA